jgi:hypothetical protein
VNLIKRLPFALVFLLVPAYGSVFTTGNLVVSVEGNSVVGGSGTYTDNQAAPLSLFQYSAVGTSSASYVNSVVLPQSQNGANLPVSGEYGSSSEGGLQLSGNGQYLTIMGYGVNAAQFNANPGSFSPSASNTALGQSGSLTGQSYTPVSRVLALVDANGNVNSTTGLYNIFDANNPRSAYTSNGSTIYVSGQGAGGDSTGGVFYTTVGSSSATPITGNDAGGGTSQDTRYVQIYNGQLYASVDSKSGSTNRSYLGTLGSGTPTGTVGAPTQLPGTGTSTGKFTITAATTNGINSAGQQINLSPEDYYFANSTTLYIADSGDGKQDSANSALGDGGLQKWTLNTVTGMWSLDYTISAGLGLVANTNTHGTSGLLGLAGEVVNGEVELYATNYTLSDLDPTFLFGVTDPLLATVLPGGESFTTLATAPADSNFKGVAFAPTVIPEPSSVALFGLGLAVVAAIGIRKRKNVRV